ncbi:MAG: ThiF family adenylyltransferase [Euryarchaeota archaeon]|nr:ThiF family adenylyltransferase [Euryarchaeota archaeon]MBU4144054.1 ThiF family adenylyltransferase [Candidatus Thermoplasmatota archaeon]
MLTSCTSLKTITKASGIKPTELGEQDVHDRQKRLPFWNQGKISQSSIGVVGCGGLGAEYLQKCARMGVGRLVFCDSDIIQLSNLNRQPFFECQKGENKALATLENLKGICTAETMLEAYALDFQDLKTIYPDAFANVDLIACLVDNEQTRHDVSAYGLKHGIPVIFSAVSETSLNGYVSVQIGGGPCYNCSSPIADSNPSKKQCADPSVIYIHTVVIGVAVFATAWLTLGKNLPWNFYPLNLDAESTPYLRKKRAGCEACGGIA